MRLLRKNLLRRRALALLVGCLVCRASIAIAADGPIRPGDLVVTNARAPLMSGRQVLLNVDRGQELTAEKVQKAWVLVKVHSGERLVKGWLHRRFLEKKARSGDGAAELESRFEFRASYVIPKAVFTDKMLLLIFGGDQTGLRPWQVEEKEAFRTQLAYIREVAPGLIDWATAGRAIRLYRVEKADPFAPDAVTGYEAVEHAARVPDDAMRRIREKPESATCARALAHELVHAADAWYRLSWRDEWTALVKPRLDRIRRKFVAKAGQAAWFPAMTDQEHAALLDPLARREGLPTGYASKSLSEALAEATSYTVFDPTYQPPVELRRFIEANVLARPSLSEKRPIGFLHQALLAIDEGRVDEAVHALDEAIKERPKLYGAYYLRAMCLRGKDNDRAKADFNVVIESTPELFGQAIISRAQWLGMATDDWKQAIDDIDRYLREYPRPPKGYIPHAIKASIYTRARQYPKAILACVDLLHLEPKEPSATVNLMFALQGLLRYRHHKDASIRLAVIRSFAAVEPILEQLSEPMQRMVISTLESARQDKEASVRRVANDALKHVNKADKE